MGETARERPRDVSAGILGVDEVAGRRLQHFFENVYVRFSDRPEALRVEGGLDQADAKVRGRVPHFVEQEADQAFAIADVAE